MGWQAVGAGTQAPSGDLLVFPACDAVCICTTSMSLCEVRCIIWLRATSEQANMMYHEDPIFIAVFLR